LDADPPIRISNAHLEAYAPIWAMYDDALENLTEEGLRTGEHIRS
jgi:hypothetical protein